MIKLLREFQEKSTNTFDTDGRILKDYFDDFFNLMAECAAFLGEWILPNILT